MTINELREKRAKLIADARAILDTASSDKRDVTAEEDARYTVIMTDVDKLGAQIAREERLAGLEAELRQSQGSIARTLNGRGDQPTDERRAAFQRYLRTGELRTTTGYNVGTDGEGGALVPAEFVPQLFKALADVNVMRQIGRVLPPVASNAVIPSFTPVGTAAWVAEEGTYTAAAHTGFAKNAMGAHKAGSHREGLRGVASGLQHRHRVPADG
jgi:HK97 family phage major capsid protein